VRGLETVIANKDLAIADHLAAIEKLTEGNVQELKDIRLMFFST